MVQTSAHTAPRFVDRGEQRDHAQRSVWFECIHKVNVRKQLMIKVTGHWFDQISLNCSKSMVSHSPTHLGNVLGWLRHRA